MKNFVAIEELDLTEVHQLLDWATAFKQGETATPTPVFVANLFFESSTRTHLSFEVAERRMGMQVIPFDASQSSINKGESLYDTLLTLEAIGVEVAVIRHTENNYYEDLIPRLNMSIINGGDGSGHHPSQSLLDLLTIRETFGEIRGLNILISGDLLHSRVARSNAHILHQMGANLYFSGPTKWYDESFNRYGRHCEIDAVLPQMDVVMLLRVQHERHAAETSLTKDKYHDTYGLTIARAKQLKTTAIIMHPSPVNRGVEIADELVESSHSRIVEQMANGVYARMAILEAITNQKRGN
ncbi:aspartate carbamoyltransferase catalytic subunit [Brochothrix thermosphacta]|uniref:aspartate carbamoyltransferase catalytic subunit n=1 Tax=Brochothrix thermosphacta TaxID=2756 RepID=UPI002712AE32|nr:aspartate carbamoyltransferase catalytic subunit [Brochothrix thermosphacta]MDO7862877.1 aspartate carbamoyltransferase catalytic subunit [Brochothrix thermosphacta]